MKPHLKWGAIAILAAIAAPIVFSFIQNPFFETPTWWAIAYLVFSQAFPAGKKPSAAALAVQVGQLAWLVDLMVHSNQGFPAVHVEALLLAAGLVWLFVTQGRMAAGLLLLLQAGLFAEKAFGLIWLAFQTKFLVDSEQLGLMRYVGTASLLMHVVAIFFLARFILNAQPSPSPAAAVVD